jgi:hypothetical protein
VEIGKTRNCDSSNYITYSRHVVKEGMPEHRNAGTPECRNTGMPEHRNTGMPEHRNIIFTLKENLKKYFKFIRNFLFKIKAFQHE